MKKLILLLSCLLLVTLLVVGCNALPDEGTPSEQEASAGIDDPDD